VEISTIPESPPIVVHTFNTTLSSYARNTSNEAEVNKVLTNYNSKLMNSIWGQYNLYASHAFQKNSEGSYAFLDFINVPQVKNLWDSLRTTH